MSRETKTRVAIAALIYSMTNAVLFGTGMIVLLSIPSLREWWADGYLAEGIVAVVVLSFVLAAPIAWWLAPRLRARYWRRRALRDASARAARDATLNA
jgi:thiosulfate reductase cytochrome b subunit